jgi:leader peptidase (prepilin peptidase)/N-methyltransferase
MSLNEAFASEPWLLALAVALLGATVGSFLNVVALRIPQMMEAEWQREARNVLEPSFAKLLAWIGADRQAEARKILELDLPADHRPVSLTYPPSTCPHCGTQIKPWFNVPILGWLWLRGRAACCGNPISIQYPLVEALSVALSLLCLQHFGFSLQLAAALVFTWMLLALAVIDFNTHYLPDSLTFPLLWIGLLLSVIGLFVHPAASIMGAVAGYLSLWVVHQLFLRLTGKEGMGHGDFKLLAALGAWMGWPMLPMIILFSSLVGSIVGISLMLLGRLGRYQHIGFGPYLAGAGFLALLYGHELMGWYLGTRALGQ